MTALAWILASSLLMGLIALTGALTLALGPLPRERLILPLVAFSAGAMLAGAVVHLLPEAIERLGAGPRVWLSALAGFAAFLLLEQVIHWRHLHREPGGVHPVGWLIIFGDGLHNLLDGVAVASAFLTDPSVGLATLVAVAAHELPQELGDFGVLVHAGWSPRRALAYNVLSSFTFLAGGLLVWAAAQVADVGLLLPFAAGNLLYIAAVDLLPEVKAQARLGRALALFGAFAVGAGLLIAMHALVE